MVFFRLAGRTFARHDIRRRTGDASDRRSGDDGIRHPIRFVFQRIIGRSDACFPLDRSERLRRNRFVLNRGASCWRICSRGWCHPI
jgi:hypothetical protein